jgi:hypothetical protein
MRTQHRRARLLAVGAGAALVGTVLTLSVAGHVTTTRAYDPAITLPGGGGPFIVKPKKASIGPTPAPGVDTAITLDGKAGPTAPGP